MKTQFDVTKLILSTKAEDINLTGNEKHTLLVMSNYFNDKETKGLFKCFTSHKTLADYTGYSVATIKRAITKLELLGYITSRKQLDNAKIYTWLGFDEVKSEEALRHILSEEKRLASKKKLDKERGVILGKNSHHINKIKQILEGSPNCENAKAQLKYAIEARKNNILFSNYQPYKDTYTNHNLATTEEFFEYIPETIIGEQPNFEEIPLDYYNDNHQNNPLQWASSVEDFEN